MMLYERIWACQWVCGIRHEQAWDFQRGWSKNLKELLKRGTPVTVACPLGKSMEIRTFYLENLWKTSTNAEVAPLLHAFWEAGAKLLLAAEVLEDLRMEMMATWKGIPPRKMSGTVLVCNFTRKLLLDFWGRWADKGLCFLITHTHHPAKWDIFIAE